MAMKKILVPTDFSDAAQNAFRYAVELAAVLRPEAIEVAHVFLPETAGEADFIPPVVQLLESRKEMLRSFIADLAAEFDPLPCPIHQETLVGFPADEIVQASEQVDLIIMGTTGQSGFLEKAFGSVSSSTAQRAVCPVLLIPHDAVFSPYRHIIYASNYDSADPSTLERLMAFNAHFNAQVHFVHIKAGSGKLPGQTKEEIFSRLFAEGEPHFAFEIAEVEAETVTAGLSRYAEQSGANLVVMATRQRGFWQSIFHRSETKRMAMATTLPMMVMHLR
jgi:nucleotide-binding universal stress UspA family protein